MVSLQNLVECIENIHHDKSTKFQRPGKIRRASRSEYSDFLK